MTGDAVTMMVGNECELENKGTMSHLEALPFSAYTLRMWWTTKKQSPQKAPQKKSALLHGTYTSVLYHMVEKITHQRFPGRAEASSGAL